MSLNNIYSNDKIMSLIGNPIELSYFVLGSISASGGSGSADFNYSITGSNNSAKVYVVASKELGLWKIDQQVIQVSDSRERIYLVEESK